MCGIAGYCSIHDTGLPAPAVLQRMVGAIRHRGPDGEGIHVAQRASLGHARLSIIDLEGGRQPLSNEDGSVWVTLNGEIFNYVELRNELVARGHVFRTHSDTETIVHAYEEFGPDCVTAFNGDFAFGLWDERRSRLLLARDRMGVRPLYYTVRNGTLVFASEVKALLQYPGVRAELDPVALDQCFTFWFPLAPRTPYKDISELPPGHMLTVEGGRISVKPYWKLCYPAAADADAGDRRSEGEVAEELRALLIDATRIRLRADVPVGAYLSGGLDSSATTALINLFPGSRLRTFSVNFESPEFDETAWQQELVRALGTQHSSIECSGDDIASLFPDVVRHGERPLLRTAPAPLYMLSKLVRENGFKVVMTGEGADEVLGGYDIFKEAKVRRFWARQPQSKWRARLLGRLYPYLSGLQKQPQAYLEAFFRIGIERPGDPLFSHLPRFETTRRGKRFFSDEMRGALAGYDAMQDMRDSLPREFESWHPLSQAQYLETSHLLPGYILSSQGDRVAMAHAVEGRFPFLDHRIVEFAARIPPRMKLKGLREKHILREAVAPLLPDVIAKRPKQPYRAPESVCFAGPHAPAYVRELLSPRAIAAAGHFDPDSVRRLLAKCAAGTQTGTQIGTSDNMALVGILSTQLLDHLYAGGTAEPSRAPALACA
jgi:asparagine synthase (glutamine-hydrolysing)